jgi:hypothetical protein
LPAYIITQTGTLIPAQITTQTGTLIPAYITTQKICIANIARKVNNFSIAQQKKDRLISVFLRVLL